VVGKQEYSIKLIFKEARPKEIQTI